MRGKRSRRFATYNKTEHPHTPRKEARTHHRNSRTSLPCEAVPTTMRAEAPAALSSTPLRTDRTHALQYPAPSMGTATALGRPESLPHLFHLAASLQAIDAASHFPPRPLLVYTSTCTMLACATARETFLFFGIKRIDTEPPGGGPRLSSYDTTAHHDTKVDFCRRYSRL